MSLGPLAIHAAKGFPRWAQAICDDDLNYQDELRRHRLCRVADLPRGAVIATCRLVACATTRKLPHSPWRHLLTPQERNFGDYRPGPYAWVLADVVALPEPVPAVGALGLWEWEPAGNLLVPAGMEAVRPGPTS